MEDLDKFLKSAEENLNDSHRHFKKVANGLALEFQELKLQACIFQYDICIGMVSVLRNQPNGFACSATLKGLVLHLFEYDQVLKKQLIPKLLSLAKSRDIPIDQSTLRSLRKNWKNELSKLEAWSDVRNQAAGHYGANLKEQVSLIESLNVDNVMFVARGFLSFNMEFLVLLRNAGRNE